MSSLDGEPQPLGHGVQPVDRAVRIDGVLTLGMHRIGLNADALVHQRQHLGRRPRPPRPKAEQVSRIPGAHQPKLRRLFSRVVATSPAIRVTIRCCRRSATLGAVPGGQLPKASTPPPAVTAPSDRGRAAGRSPRGSPGWPGPRRASGDSAGNVARRELLQSPAPLASALKKRVLEKRGRGEPYGGRRPADDRA